MRASSRETARLTPDGVRPSASAARTKLPPSTTAVSTLTPFSNRPSNIVSSLIFRQQSWGGNAFQSKSFECRKAAEGECSAAFLQSLRVWTSEIAHAAVDDQFAADGVGRFIGGEEDDRLGDFARIAETADRDLRLDRRGHRLGVGFRIRACHRAALRSGRG